MNKKHIAIIVYSVIIFNALMGMDGTEWKTCFIRTPLYPMQESSCLSNLLISDTGEQYRQILANGEIQQHSSRNISVIQKDRETTSCQLYISTADSSFGIYANNYLIKVTLTHAQLEQLKNKDTQARYTNNIILDDEKNIYDIKSMITVQESLSDQIDNMNQQTIYLCSTLQQTLQIAQKLSEEKQSLESQQIDLSQQYLKLEQNTATLAEKNQSTEEQIHNLTSQNSILLRRQKYLIGITTTSMLALMVIIARYLL